MTQIFIIVILTVSIVVLEKKEKNVWGGGEVGLVKHGNRTGTGRHCPGGVPT